jgi:hypothetical protein
MTTIPVVVQWAVYSVVGPTFGRVFLDNVRGILHGECFQLVLLSGNQVPPSHHHLDILRGFTHGDFWKNLYITSDSEILVCTGLVIYLFFR